MSIVARPAAVSPSSLAAERAFATNSALIACFNARIDAVVAALAGRPAVVVLMGFGLAEARVVADRPDSLSTLCGAPLPMADDGIDLAALLARPALRAARNALEDAEAPVVCLFEQFAPLAGALAACYDGQIVVVRNDLFDGEGRYPSPVSASELRQFESYAERPADEALDAPLSAALYATTERAGDGYVVSHLRGEWAESALCREVGLYGACPQPRVEVDCGATGEPAPARIPVPGASFTSFKLALSSFTACPTQFVVDKGAVRGGVCADPAVAVCAALLGDAGCACRVTEGAKANAGAEYVELLRPLLQRYWGKTGDEKPADFRSLKFFKDPDRSMELEEVSQGVVAGYAVAQAEAALDGSDDYTDLFVTAPTGAGKSLLFQLPALYLAEKRGAVTLVIEPLKALMRDQVRGLRARGVKNVAVINGDISFAERTEEYERVRSGEASIVYLSPELLLSSSVEAVIGTRELGMVVVDEAHTVTTWGKDFRPDYWYLGAYLSKAKRAGRRFPIFCLTATAVYGGVDDVVMQTVADLELTRCKLFLGCVRRDDISFDIRVRSKKDCPGLVDEVKTRMAAERIAELATLGEGKSLVYCPYRSHVEAIMEEVDEGLKATGAVMGYHGGMASAYRTEVQRRFESGECRVMVSTKAFGMGVDVDDIVNVYHFAPTGNISDYVQEIGRGARRSDLEAVAEMDFFKTDANYYRTLYALSSFSQVQLREVMRKMYSLYKNRPHQTQNMLVSPESFSYLFDDDDADRRANKAKSALLMVAKDLERRCNYPVLVVAPGTAKTRNYVCVADETADAIAARYGEGFLHLRKHQGKRVVRVPGANSRSSAVTASDIGSIYELETARLWETHFSQFSFNDFKRRLFEGEILGGAEGLAPVSPRTRLAVSYQRSYQEVCDVFDVYVDALGAAFDASHRSGAFTETGFRDALKEALGDRAPMPQDPGLLLASFVMPYTGDRSRAKRSVTKCVTKCKRGGAEATQTQYKVDARMVEGMKAALRRTIAACAPNEEDGRYVTYLNRLSYAVTFEVAEILEVLGLAVYENLGGTGSDLFVRLNSPSTLRRFAANHRFTNEVLRDLKRRHERSTGLITRFFTADMDDVERWDVVEHYFLGHDDQVCARLGLTSEGVPAPVPVAAPSFAAASGNTDCTAGRVGDPMGEKPAA